MKSNSFELGSKGTPQGDVLSPLLFNLALRGLPEALGAVPGVEHAIYADDITLWCREGNDAEIEERLQAAAKIVKDYAEECGLKCAQEKSELLVLRNPYERVSEQIEVWVSGKRVSKPTEIRILGQLIRQGRGNKSTIDKLDTMTTQLKRLASTKNGAWLMDKLGMAVPGGTHTGTVPDHELSAEIRKKIVLSVTTWNRRGGGGKRKMEVISTEALVLSPRTGYDPDKVAFDSINPAARPLHTDGIQKTASEEQVGTLPGNSWVQVLHRKKTQKKEVHDQRKEDRGPTGSMKSNSFELGSKGTPQGDVLSPLLFNLALRGLPEALGAVPGVEHAIYADITLWCREGNDAEIEERLQAAAKIVKDYAEECGLKCAQEKSELLVLRNPYERVSEQIEVWVSGKRVSKPTEIRILGQLIRQGRGNKSTIDKLDTMTTQLKRLASTKNGAWLMDKLGMAVPGGTHTGTVPDHELSAEIRKKIVVSRIPRNMQPGKDDSRRKARSEALSKTWDHREGTLYVDCGGPVNGVPTIAVANAQGRVLR
ncbi:hypothetical protein ISCGN_031941 [Ixodes scapularis]